MAWRPVSGLPQQYAKDGDELASSYYLKFYRDNTTDVINMATDNTGATQLQKAKLNTSGYPISNVADDNTVFIPHLEEDYRAVLYPNETEADADNTAAAIWNIADTSLGIVFAANAEDIVLRDTTIKIQDDYDRSIKFTNGDGFTAGAGPHVITVTSDYDPTSGDFKVYRADTSNIYVELTPTSTTATTFTITETLLSTDVIFLGDDTSRQIAVGATSNDVNYFLKPNGDLSELDDIPASRTTLDVYSKSETYTQAEVGTLVDGEVATLEALIASSISDYFDAATAQNGLGSFALMLNNSGGIINEGATISASGNLVAVSFTPSGGTASGGTAETGTWRAMSTVSNTYIGLFAKISS
jgi:hypothetical protein